MCEKNLEIENARVFIQIAHKQREHWNSLIQNLMYLSISGVFGVWAFFYKAFIESGESDVTYLYIIILVSIAIIVFWRSQTHHLENLLIQNYIESIYYENILGSENTKLTKGYLMRLLRIERVPNINFDTLSPDTIYNGFMLLRKKTG